MKMVTNQSIFFVIDLNFEKSEKSITLIAGRLPLFVRLNVVGVKESVSGCLCNVE